MMKIEIRALNFSVAPEQISFIERRVTLALRSHSDRISLVEVWLSDIRAADYASGKRCLLQVELEERTIVISESIDPDLNVAIHHAADQASRKVPRCLGRRARLIDAQALGPGNLTESRLRSEYTLR